MITGIFQEGHFKENFEENWNSDSQNEFLPELEELSHSDHGKTVVMCPSGAPC